jgi:Secretion system C-terminal sorting domain
LCQTFGRNATQRNATFQFLLMLLFTIFSNQIFSQYNALTGCNSIICGNGSFEISNPVGATPWWNVNSLNGLPDNTPCWIPVAGSPQVFSNFQGILPPQNSGNNFGLMVATNNTGGGCKHEAMAWNLSKPLAIGQPYTITYFERRFGGTQGVNGTINYTVGFANGLAPSTQPSCAIPNLTAPQPLPSIAASNAWTFQTRTFTSNIVANQVVFNPIPSTDVVPETVTGLLIDNVDMSCPSLLNSSFVTTFLGDNTYQFTLINNNPISGVTVINNQWFFGDGTASFLADPIHKFPNSGTFNICVSVVDSRGCCLSFCQPLSISDCMCSAIPKVIGGETANGTPNTVNAVTWTGNVEVNQNIIIPPGRTLTIDAANVKVVSPCMFTVMRGGRMIVNNSTIDSKCTNQLWRGIDVWGNPNIAQTATMRNISTILGTDDPGVLTIKGNSNLNNGNILIQDHKDYLATSGDPSLVALDNKTAQIATWTSQTQADPWSYRGGLIDVEDVNFSGNRKVAEFFKYDFENFSRFKKLHINNVGNLNATSYEGVTIWDTDKIKFDNCDFVNVRSNAITTYDAGIIMNNSLFDKNKRGIIVLGNNFHFRSEIGQGGLNTFQNSDFGIQLGNAYNTDIVGNIFNNCTTAGIEATGECDFLIWQNKFQNAQLGQRHSMTGGSQKKDIFCNEYTTTVGNAFFGNLLGTSIDNESYSCFIDIGLINFNNTTTGVNTLGNLGTQGSITSPRWNRWSSLNNNIFSPVSANISVKFDYFHPNPFTTPPTSFKLIPSCDDDDACLGNVNNYHKSPTTSGSSLPTCFDLFLKNQNERCKTKSCMDSTDVRLLQLVNGIDGGNQTNLLNLLSSSPSSISTSNTLKSASPYLSDVVLKAIVNATTMSPDNREALLLSNAPLSNEVMAAANGQVSNSCWNNLVQIKNGGTVSARRTNEIEQEQLRIRKATAMADLTAEVIKTGDFNAADALWANNISFEAKRWKLDIRLEANDYAGAQSVLNLFPNTNPEEIYSKQVEQIWLNRFNTTTQYKPNATQKAFLQQQATMGTRLGARARSVLWQLTGEYIDPIFEEIPLNLAGASADRSENWTPKPVTREQRLMIQPNPANDYVDITLNGLDLSQIKTIRVQSTTGVVVKEIVPDTHNFSISTDRFPSGIYFVQLIDQFGSYLAVKKVLIQH